MDDKDGRKILTARLRALADWLDANPEVPVSPYGQVQVYQFTDDMDIARAARASAPGGWDKDTSPVDNYITYQHKALPELDDSDKWTVQYALHVSKSATCERVQTGVRHIEEHDEPVYEWKCDA